MGGFLSTSKKGGSTPSDTHNFHKEDEDDFYMVHRKDAMTMMRSASDHSKAAKEAYERGDHSSAKRSSQKAQEEQIAAKNLHAVAAKKILKIKNHKNDKWTLDLHGLHADEAVQAVQEQLRKIESTKSSKSLSVIVSFLSSFIRKKSTKKKESNKEPSSSKNLNVITGKGIHSRGEAKLPTAIRSFLNENGYDYDDETRPGVIIVRPKFQ